MPIMMELTTSEMLTNAMSTATPDIKALAKMVVADNDHDGIAEVVAEVFGVTA